MVQPQPHIANKSLSGMVRFVNEDVPQFEVHNFLKFTVDLGSTFIYTTFIKRSCQYLKIHCVK